MEEKIALFWHGLFATGYTKLNQARTQLNQVDMFRRSGLGSFEDHRWPTADGGGGPVPRRGSTCQGGEKGCCDDG